jgi:hypothetical protein
VAYGYPTPGHPVSSVLSSSLIAFIVDLFLLDRFVFFSIFGILSRVFDLSLLVLARICFASGRFFGCSGLATGLFDWL